MRDPSGEGELAGILDATAFLPDGVPAHWSVYWQVDDVDAALARVEALGGSIVTASRTPPTAAGHGDRPGGGPVQAAPASAVVGSDLERPRRPPAA